MPRSLPSTVIQAVNAQTTNNTFLVLLEASHSTFTTVRLVNNTQAIVAGANTYQPFPFAVILPPDDPELQVKARVVVSNVTVELMDELRGVAGSKERIQFALKVIEASAPTVVLQSVSGLTAASVQYDADMIQIDLTIDNFLTEAFPSDTFSPNTFPGIF